MSSIYPRAADRLQVDDTTWMELFTPADDELLYEKIRADVPHLNQDGGWAGQVTPQKAGEMLQTMVENTKNGLSAAYKLFSSELGPDPFAGDFNLFHRLDDTMGIGFWLVKKAEGKGIVSRAGVTVIQYAFENLGIRTVWGEANKDNHRSIKSLGNMGLRRADNQTSRDLKYQDPDKIIFERHRNG